MKNQSPRSKEWKEYLDKSELENLGHFAKESNDTGSVPGNELVMHDNSVRDGHDYRHLANAHKDMGLKSDEVSGHAPKSILGKVAKTARGRLHQAIADEHQFDHLESEGGMTPEEILMAKDEKIPEEPLEQGEFAEETEEAILEAREDWDAWEDSLSETVERLESNAKAKAMKIAEEEKTKEEKWAMADSSQEKRDRAGEKTTLENVINYNNRTEMRGQFKGMKEGQIMDENWDGTIKIKHQKPLIQVDQTRSEKARRETLRGKLPKIESNASTGWEKAEDERLSHTTHSTVENGEIQLFAQYAKNPIMIEKEVELMEKGGLGLGSLHFLVSELYDIYGQIPEQDKWALDSVKHLIEMSNEQIEDYEYERKIIAEFMKDPEETTETEGSHWVPESETRNPTPEKTSAKHTDTMENFAELTEKKIEKKAIDRAIAEKESRYGRKQAPTPGDRQSRAREIDKIRRSGRKAA